MSFAALQPYPLTPSRGMGATTAQIAGSAVTSGLSITGLLLPLLIAGTGPIGAIIAAAGAILGPIIASFNGCGPTCTQATEYANQAGDALTQVLNLYLNAPTRTKSLQAGVLAQMQQLFDAMRQACSQPALGDAGKRCISERLDRNACQWQASPGKWTQDAAGKWNWTFYGPAGSGTACWNYVVGFYDVVAGDPGVVDDSVSSASLSSLTAGVSSSPLLLFGLLGLAGLGIYVATK